MGVDLNDCRTSRMPDDRDQNFGWVIKRAGTDLALKLIVLSEDIFGIRTHFFRGRTGPCIITRCDACAHKQLSRWKGYVLAVDASNGQQCIFEFTPPAAVALDEARKVHGTMRGLQLVVSRASKKPNARVVVTVKGITVLRPGTCPSYHVWPILAKIWGIDSDDTRDIELGDLDDRSEFERQAQS